MCDKVTKMMERAVKQRMREKQEVENSSWSSYISLVLMT